MWKKGSFVKGDSIFVGKAVLLVVNLLVDRWMAKIGTIDADKILVASLGVVFQLVDTPREVARGGDYGQVIAAIVEDK
jgi:hypothetical protein